MSHTLNSYQIELPDISPLSFLSKSVLMQHIFCVEASPHNGVEACYLTVSKLMVSPHTISHIRCLTGHGDEGTEQITRSSTLT